MSSPLRLPGARAVRKSTTVGVPMASANAVEDALPRLPVPHEEPPLPVARVVGDAAARWGGAVRPSHRRDHDIEIVTNGK